MAKKNTKRKLVGMVSEASGVRQYYTTYNPQNELQKQNGGESFSELRKYDPKVRRHVTFKITKKSLGRNEVKPRKG